jgi:hypothetical protein
MLTEEEKKLAVLHSGILVAKRNNSTCLFFLFQMDHFYVETCCHIEGKRIEGFRMFHHLKLLEPYLKTIAIGDLLN